MQNPREELNRVVIIIGRFIKSINKNVDVLRYFNFCEAENGDLGLKGDYFTKPIQHIPFIDENKYLDCTENELNGKLELVKTYLNILISIQEKQDRIIVESPVMMYLLRHFIEKKNNGFID